MPLKLLLLLSLSIIFSGCWLSHKPVPLPAGESEYAKPVQKPLVFSAPRKIRWNDVKPDSIRQGQILPFDLNKLPSKPFHPNSFSGFTKPPQTFSFDYNSIADTILDMDRIPDEPLYMKTTLIGGMKKTTLGDPKVKNESWFTSFLYSEEQGLPGANVESTLRTRDGLLWIGTNNGLCILNGDALETFPGSYGTIYCMAEDIKGQVWVRTREGAVYVIDRKAGIQKQANFNLGIHLRIDKKGFVWISSYRDGIFVVNPNEKSFKHITSAYGLAENFSTCTMEDREGRIWVGNRQHGVDIIDPSAKTIKRLGQAQGLGSSSCISLLENEQGDVFSGSALQGLDIVNIKNKTRQHFDTAQGISRSVIFTMVEDTSNRTWIGSDVSGVYILNKSKDSILHIGTQQGLGDDAVWCISKDYQGQILVGTLNGGMNIFPTANRVAHRLSVYDGLLDNQDWGLLTDSKKRLWIGSYSGVNILTPDQRLITFLPNTTDKNTRSQSFLQIGPDRFVIGTFGYGLSIIDESKHTIEKIGLKEGLPTVNVFSLLNDSKGRIWIGTLAEGIVLFDPVKKTIRSINQSGGLGQNRIDEVNEIDTNLFVISTFKGLDFLNLKDNTITTYSFKEGLSNDQIGGTLKDSKGRLWVPTERGLNLVDLTKKTNTIFAVSAGMPSNGIYSLLEKDHVIYAGTGKGLTTIKEEESKSGEPTWKLQTYGRPQGFGYLDFNGRTAAYSASNQFWWGIIQGITTMDESVMHIDTASSVLQITGLDILNKGQYFIDPGLIKNVDTLYSEIKDTFYLKENFSSLNTDRKIGIKWDSLSDMNLPVNLSLPPERNYLRFHYSNSLPQNEGYYKYRYILDGIDEKWSPVTDQTSTESYNNISPGYYGFRVSEKKGEGAWGEPTVFHFRIRPPWWLSWWAELIYLILFVCLIRTWVSYRSHRLKKENAMLEHKVTERTNELSTSLENLRQAQGHLIQAEKMASLGELTAGIAHEIQNPLNFVNNFSEVNTELIEDIKTALNQGDIPEAQEIMKDVEMNMSKITFHGKRADAIVKGMLLHSRASSGQKIPTDINALADEYLRLSYHGLRAKDKSFNAQFNMDFDKTIEPVMLVQQDVGRVLLNLFNNSFYSVTEKKKQFPNENFQPTVSVATKRKKDSIEIRIRDNGQGIPKKVIDKIYQPFFTTKPAGQGTGLGLSLSYDIITKEHNGKINVTTSENEFTEFIIDLPAQPV